MGSNRWLRNGFVYLLVIIGIIVIFYTLLPSFGGSSERPLSTVIAMAKNNDIREIQVDGKKLTVYPNSGEQFTSRISNETDIVGLLTESGVELGTPRRGRGLVQRVQRTEKLLRVTAEFPAPDILRRPDPVHDAAGPGQQQPDPELRPEPGADDDHQPSRSHFCRRGWGG